MLFRPMKGLKIFLGDIKKVYSLLIVTCNFIQKEKKLKHATDQKGKKR